ncbi:protease SohB [Moraxella sp. Tifton1]|uniref:protease SohB n=1 Tax=Moraxella oculi TaxID=2940516 RepID=UPI002011634D|nr:protease SohB [Moraxella sp. Tifton1]MCL1622848.1 protease SohB [Moraxella sp. Tifton1]
MLFHSSKKPVELQLIHLNKIKREHQKQFEKVKSANAKKTSCFSKMPFGKLIGKVESESDVPSNDKVVYVLDFEGDIKASAVGHLREEISAIIVDAKEGDEVVLRLESGGGQVNAYGLAAAQLERIKSAGLSLTVCVDKIAASGGYMMACVADQIIASDFAVIGSVGVVSQLPNFHELMKKHHIGYEMFTAGDHKRTVTVFGENTDEDRAKYQADIDRIHELFKQFVSKHRSSLDINKVATGEFWFGKDAKYLCLIDEIGTSDAYVMKLMEMHDVFVLHSRSKPTLLEKLGLAEQVGASFEALMSSTGMSISKMIGKLNRP